MSVGKTGSRIEEAFRKRTSPLLITCAVAGDPDYDGSLQVIQSLAEAGADIIELVMPFSDPVADGPVIQEAGARALASGMTTDRLISLIRDARERTGIPIIVMTYANIVIQRGIDRFYRDVADAGADGVVVADVPVEEAEPFCTAGRTSGIDPILFVSQTTSPERLEKICTSAKGFLYLVAAMGVTGVREGVDPGTLALIRSLQKNTVLPLVPGFGISSPDQVRTYSSEGVDGMIVGSAIVRVIGENGKSPGEMKEAIHHIVRRLKEAAITSGSGTCR